MTSRDRGGPPQPAPDAAAVEKLVEEIRAQLQRASRGGHPKAADVHRLGLDFVRRMRTGGLALAMAVADPLMRSGDIEEGMVGNQLVAAMVRHIGGSEFDRFDQWVDALTSEINTDGLASHIISRAVAGKPSLVNRLLEWTKSPSPWRRRAAVLAFSPMVREGRFITDSFSVAEKLLNDPDETVQRGVGMMLIEASRLKADRVFEFLEPRKGDCAKLVLSAAAQKLSQAQRSALLGT